MNRFYEFLAEISFVSVAERLTRRPLNLTISAISGSRLRAAI